MRIIIIGCGKVGRALARQLSAENHDIVIVDTQARKLQEFNEDVDAICLTGNGASIGVQQEAGIETTDVLIAVTGSDELNLLCCLVARKVSQCHTIARVRNPVYQRDISFIKERMGISMIINPEYNTAIEIARLLRFPSALQIDNFAGGNVRIIKFKVLPEFKIDGVKIMDLPKRFPSKVLICAVERDDMIAIPSGNFMLKNGDLVSIVGAPEDCATFFHQLGLSTQPVKNALIVGGGTVGYYLADKLLEYKMNVRIIEKDQSRCETLCELLPGASIIHGEGSDKKVLLQSGITAAEAVISLTSMDEENIFLSQYLKERTNAKLVTKVTRIAFDSIIQKLDIGSVVYPKYITADSILQYVRALQNSVGNSVQTLCHILNNRAEALEFSVKSSSRVLNVPLYQLQLKKNLLVCSINRGGKIIIPKGQDTIQAGDTVIIVTTQKALQDIDGILARQG